jgi:hypothetical protein
MWDFHAVKEAVVKKMSSFDIDVVEKIVLARDHHVPEWFLPSLNEYTRLPRSMTRKDVNCLNLDFILKIVRVRENRFLINSYYSGTSSSWRNNVLKATFREEIELLEEWNSRDGLDLEGTTSQYSPNDHESLYFIDMFFLVCPPARLI